MSCLTKIIFLSQMFFKLVYPPTTRTFPPFPQHLPSSHLLPTVSRPPLVSQHPSGAPASPNNTTISLVPPTLPRPPMFPQQRPPSPFIPPEPPSPSNLPTSFTIPHCPPTPISPTRSPMSPKNNKIDLGIHPILIVLAGSALTMLGLWGLFFSPLKGSVINNIASCIVFLMGIGLLASILTLNKVSKPHQQVIHNDKKAKIVSLSKDGKTKKNPPVI